MPPNILNPFEISIQLFDLLLEWSTALYNFLFTPITLNFLLTNITFTPFFAIATSLVVTLLIMKLVKDFIPGA
jgi:hypothetical protein